jgi:hypothetical protein
VEASILIWAESRKSEASLADFYPSLTPLSLVPGKVGGEEIVLSEFDSLYNDKLSFSKINLLDWRLHGLSSCL